MNKKLNLNPPSGFPELTHDVASHFIDATQRILEVFSSHGFTPLITPLVERLEVLTAKSDGEITTQLFGLVQLQDEKQHVRLGLRFDHTVPLVRHVAAHYRELSFPFRRSAIGPVFRGERPKGGRYRQFTQADIDTLERGDANLWHDAEIMLVIAKALATLNIGSFTFRVNDRQFLSSALRAMGVAETQLSHACRVIDRIHKRGTKWVSEELGKLGVADVTWQRFLSEGVQSDIADETSASQVQKLVSLIQPLMPAQASVVIDPSLARGLDYYTGMVFEVTFDAYPQLGSVAGGGRYDSLIADLGGPRDIKGVGASIGLTRLLLRAVEAGLYNSNSQTRKVALLSDQHNADTFAVLANIADLLRKNDVIIEQYLQPKPLSTQLRWADRNGFEWVIIHHNNSWVIRSLKTQKQLSFNEMEKVVTYLTNLF